MDRLSKLQTKIIELLSTPEESGGCGWPPYSATSIAYEVFGDERTKSQLNSIYRSLRNLERKRLVFREAERLEEAEWNGLPQRVVLWGVADFDVQQDIAEARHHGQLLARIRRSTIGLFGSPPLSPLSIEEQAEIAATAREHGYDDVLAALLTAYPAIMSA